MNRSRLTRVIVSSLLLGLVSLILHVAVAQAKEPERLTTTGAKPNSDCLMCHSDPDFKGGTGDGDLTSLYVSGGIYGRSVHGKAGLECIACHTTTSGYPHHDEEQVTCTECHDLEKGTVAESTTIRATLPFTDRRELSLQINEACRSCHEHEFEVALDSAHVSVFRSGNRAAPVCVDCHGSHDMSPPGQSRSLIAQSCGECHAAVYSSYRYSVHGAALEKESNPDVPTCVECHGVHSVRGPRDGSFHNDSITICGNCHSNETVMAKYGISTQVLDTYLDDFHGRTVDLFRRQATDLASDKAVCFDCHGVHNVQRPEDPASTVYPANLQHTCQKCHEDANIRFPDAWLSHYLPTWEETPMLFAIDTFYRLLIPLTIGFFGVYIGLDVFKRWTTKQKILRQALSEVSSDDYDFTEDV